MRRQLSARIVPEFAARMALAARRIRALPGVTLHPAAGGIYLFPGIRQTGRSSAEMQRFLLERAHVLTLPGSAFGPAGEGYLRIACTVDSARLAEAFDRVEAALREG